MTTINLEYPKSWTELDQRELYALLWCMANVQKLTEHTAFIDSDDYSIQTWAMIATRRIFARNMILVYTPYADGYLVKYRKKEYYITPGQVAALLDNVRWMREIPKEPVRLDLVGRFDAIDADLTGLPFGKWLEIENLWQGYNITHDDGLLRQIGEILYPGIEGRLFNEAEVLGVFYWIASVKQMFALRFPSFFKPTGADGDGAPVDFNTLQRAADAQIRALTKGDVTKEDFIYDTDTTRALTELDAQAKEYEEITKKYGKH